METTEWYTLPDRDNYEVSGEDEPRVRSRSTGVVLKKKANGTVSLYLSPKRKGVCFGTVRLQFAAMNGVKVELIPKNIIITKEHGEFRLTDRRDFCQKLNGRFDRGCDTERQLEVLDETVAFIRAQAEAVRTQQLGRMAELLYGYRKRAIELAGRFCYASPSLYRNMEDYASTAVVRVIDKVMRGVILTTHPTAALKTEIIKIVRSKKKTVPADDWRIYKHSKIQNK